MMAYIEQIKHETIKLQAELCFCVADGRTYHLSHRRKARDCPEGA
jgi:hypothetical protein